MLSAVATRLRGVGPGRALILGFALGFVGIWPVALGLGALLALVALSWNDVHKATDLIGRMSFPLQLAAATALAVAFGMRFGASAAVRLTLFAAGIFVGAFSFVIVGFVVSCAIGAGCI
jgi:hypothetical protein